MANYTVDGTTNQELTEAQRLILVEYGHEVVKVPKFDCVIGCYSAGNSHAVRLREDVPSSLYLSLAGQTSWAEDEGLYLDWNRVVMLRDTLTEWLGASAVQAEAEAEITADSPEPERGVEYLDAQGDVWTYGTHESFVPWTSGWFCYEEEDGDILCGPYSWAAVTSNYRHAGAFPWRAM